MAYSINKVILIGNVGNDPEIKSFQSGDRVVNFSLATKPNPNQLSIILYENS